MRKIIFALSFFTVFGCKSTAQIIPIKSGNNYTFTLANTTLVVNAAKGARISSYKVNDKEILNTTVADDYSWGSTFWFSPQDEWIYSKYGTWPPSAAVDNLAYAANIVNSVLVLTGSVDPNYQVQVRKSIWANRLDTSFTIVYTLINTSSVAQSYGPWENSRVPLGGVSFFPKGEGAFTGDAYILPKFTFETDSVVWYSYASADAQGKKMFTNGARGWTAHVRSKLLFVKQFEDLEENDIAPGQNEIEEYIGQSFIELENHGRYKNMAPGDSVSYTVKWFARELPSAMSTVARSPAMLQYTRKLVGDEVDPSAISKTKPSQVSVFPNPSSGVVKFKGLTQDCSFSLMDYAGKTVLSQNLTVAKAQADTRHLPSGVYYYQLSGTTTQEAGKLIVN